MAGRLPPGRLWPPIVGQTFGFLADPLAFLRSGAHRHGPVFKANIIGRPTVFMLGPSCNEFVLSTMARSFSWREGYGEVAHQLFGDALIMRDGQRYTAIREAMLPVFDRANLARQLPAMLEIVRAEIEAGLAQRQVQAYRLFKCLALRVALRCFTGVDVGAEGPSAVRAWVERFDRFAAGLFTPFAWRIPGTAFARAWRVRAELRGALRSLVERGAHPEEGHLAAILGVTCDADGQRLSSDAVAEQLVLMLFAGHDTTASLATWLAYEFLRHPEIAARARAEVRAHLDTDSAWGPTELSKLRYLSACIREAERLYPPAPTGFRGVVDGFEFAGFEIPAGYTVAYSPIYTHRMDSIYPDSEKFVPDRFLGPSQRPAYSLIGFGGGPRKCVGEALAQLELKLIMATWLLQVEARRLDSKPVRYTYMPALHPRGGLALQLGRLCDLA